MSASFSEARLAVCMQMSLVKDMLRPFVPVSQPVLPLLGTWVFLAQLWWVGPQLGFMIGDIIISDRRSHKELLYNQNLPASSLLSFTN